MNVRQGLWFVALLMLVVWVINHWRTIEIKSINNTVVSDASVSQSGAESTPAQQQIKQFLQLDTFRGAQVDGMLRVDHNQQLVVDRELRYWIDFHLAALGEISLADIRNTMLQQIAQLPQPGSDQAAQLLQRYLDYRSALAQFDSIAQRKLSDDSVSFERLAQRLDWQQRLRRQFFTEETVMAFFAQDEILDRYQLQRLQVAKDGGDADLELPQELVSMREKTRLIQHHQQQEQLLKEQGDTADQLHQWRQQQYGPEAAERLAKVEQQQAVWQQRVKQYVHYQKSLQVQSLDSEQQQSLLQQYRQQNFSDSEQKRLAAASQLVTDAD